MPVDFGAAFRPIAPAPPPPPDFAALVDELAQRIIAAIVALPAPEVYVESPPVDVTELVNAVVGLKGPATAAEIAEALAPLIRPPGVPAPAPDLAILTDIKDVLEKLEFRLKGSAFGGAGSGGAAPADAARDTTLQQVRDRSEYPWSSTDRAQVDTLAKEATLVSIGDVLATRATEATLAALRAIATDLRAEARRRRVHRLATGLATVAAGAAYTTIVEFTTAVPVTILGYNADFQSVATANYRMRFITGTDEAPDIWHGEEVSTGANSWQPVVFDIAAGTRVAVQVVHDQLTAQSVRGSINYYEEP